MHDTTPKPELKQHVNNITQTYHNKQTQNLPLEPNFLSPTTTTYNPNQQNNPHNHNTANNLRPPNDTVSTPFHSQNQTHNRHTFSIMKHLQNTYIIAVDTETQSTNITRILTDNITNNEQLRNQIKKFLTTIIPNHDNLTMTPPYRTYRIPTKIINNLTKLNNSTQRSPRTFIHSPIITDAENLHTLAFDLTQHPLATQNITSLLLQTNILTQNFQTSLQSLNKEMNEATQEITRLKYNRITSIRQRYTNLFSNQLLRPQNNNTNNPKRVNFSPFPIEQITPLTTQPNKANQHSAIENQIIQHPSNSTSSISIEWETAEIHTKTKNPTKPSNSLQTQPQTHTIQKLTEDHLPPCKVLLLIILLKITNAWHKANAKEPTTQDKPVKWPTFRPLRTIRTLTPISSFLILFLLATYLPLAKTDITPQTPATQIKITPTIYNQMEDNHIQNKPRSGVKNHFIYDWQGKAIINPSIHYYSIKYEACDVEALKRHLQNMITHHLELCNYIPPSTIEQQHLIQDHDQHHILINQKMNIVQARKTCNSLNSNLIEIRNENQSRLLETFMTRHAISQTFSGIYYNPTIQEFTYTTGEYITDQKTTDNNLPPPHNEWYNKPTTWKALLDVAILRNRHKPILLYTKAGTTLVTLASYQSGHHSTTYNNYHDSSIAYPICSTPKTQTTRQTIYRQWKEQCLIVHRKLQSQLQSTIKRIQLLQPRNLPQHTKNIQLFGNYNHLLHKHKLKNQTQQNINPTHTACDHYFKELENLQNNQNPQKTHVTQNTNITRQKRSPIPLEFFPPIAEYIYSAIQFISNIYTHYINTYPQSHPTPTNEQTLQYIHYITKQNAYDKDFAQTTNFIAVTNTQTKLQIHITSTNSYIHKILDKLDKHFYSNHKPEPTDFLSQTQYEALILSIYTKHRTTIPKQLKSNKIFLHSDIENYIMTLAIPLQPHKHRTDLYRLTPIPIWKNNTRYTPHITHKTFGIPRQNSRTFITMTEQELTLCTNNPYCETAKGIQKATTPPCGIDQFFYDKENCAYTKDASQENWVHQLENVIYYSIKPDTTMSMNLE